MRFSPFSLCVFRLFRCTIFGIFIVPFSAFSLCVFQIITSTIILQIHFFKGLSNRLLHFFKGLFAKYYTFSRDFLPNITLFQGTFCQKSAYKKQALSIPIFYSLALCPPARTFPSSVISVPSVGSIEKFPSYIATASASLAVYDQADPVP